MPNRVEHQPPDCVPIVAQFGVDFVFEIANRSTPGDPPPAFIERFDFIDVRVEFINDFKIKYGIPLDPIYNGKMFYGVFDLIKKGYFEKNASIVLVHTGGLQGVEGFNDFILKKHNLSIE